LNKKILVIAIAVILVVSLAAIVAYENSNRPFTVWTNLTYAGATPLGFTNSTIPGYSGIQAQNITIYNYTFTVNTNILKPMTIQSHCAAVIPYWSDGRGIAFTFTKINSTCWNFNIGFNATGPTYLVSSQWGTTLTQFPSTPPLTQTQIDAINIDFKSQNS